VLARILPFTSRDVLGSKELFIFTEDKNADEVLRLSTLNLSETARVCVLIDLASMLETTDTFKKEE
jgi:hypothetical protein